ncbi:Rid family hydrolase [Burkholderia ubonensis]|uniref:Rid family hydrolase n=1 Tax=Burkholderia ubonensis TaxID=101571 RepID=UPI000AAB2214|nr:Rid family hydrolase [Burkholderia ubonensis]
MAHRRGAARADGLSHRHFRRRLSKPAHAARVFSCAAVSARFRPPRPCAHRCHRDDGSPEPELGAQVRRAFDNLNAVLRAAGCTFDDVVDVTVFLVDPDATFEWIWQIVPEYWGDAPHPTLTAVGVTWLYGFQFEIKAIARLPEPVDG